MCFARVLEVTMVSDCKFRSFSVCHSVSHQAMQVHIFWGLASWVTGTWQALLVQAADLVLMW
jgi:hypothetical protein